MKLISCAVLAGLLLQGNTGNQTAELRFDWPRDLKARVETERTRERVTKTATSRTSRVSHRMLVSPHADGLLVEYADFKVDGVSDAEIAAISETIAAMVPAAVIAPGGEFLRVQDLERLRRAVNAMLEPAIQKRPLPRGFKDLLTNMLSDEALTSMAAQEWQILVGAWQGMRLSPEKISADTEEVSPVWPDVKVPMKVTVGMIERGECTRSGVARDCALLELQSAINQAAMETILKRLMSGMKEMESVTYERLDVVTLIRVRLETQTMVPHELAMTKTVEMRVKTPVDGITNARQIDARTSRFFY